MTLLPDRASCTWRAGISAASSHLLIVLSHHTIATMDNRSLAPGEAGPRVLGSQVRAPAWVAA